VFCRHSPSFDSSIVFCLGLYLMHNRTQGYPTSASAPAEAEGLAVCCQEATKYQTCCVTAQGKRQYWNRRTSPPGSVADSIHGDDLVQFEDDPAEGEAPLANESDGEADEDWAAQMMDRENQVKRGTAISYSLLTRTKSQRARIFWRSRD
jgi:hypothetical protein